jgi:hypothetical protein
MLDEICKYCLRNKPKPRIKFIAKDPDLRKDPEVKKWLGKTGKEVTDLFIEAICKRCLLNSPPKSGSA